MFNSELAVLTTDSGFEEYSQEVRRILEELKGNCIKPDTDTLVNILVGLSIISDGKEYSRCIEFGLNVLAEFRVLEVPLSLGVYHSFLELFDTKLKEVKTTNILNAVLEEIEGKEFWPPVSLSDLKFLPKAMIIANQ